MMGFEIVMLLFEAQMVVVVLEIIASDRNSVIMAMGTTCAVSLTLCTLSDGNHRNYHPTCELYQTWLGAIHARDKALELTNRLRSRKDAGLSASNVARIAEPELANQGNFNLRSSDHAQEGGFALIHRASATAVAAR